MFSRIINIALASIAIASLTLVAPAAQKKPGPQSPGKKTAAPTKPTPKATAPKKTTKKKSTKRRTRRHVTRRPARRTVSVSSTSGIVRAETSLVGVNIMDDGMKLINMFGNPTIIAPIGEGGGGAAAGGGGGGGGGGGQAALGGGGGGQGGPPKKKMGGQRGAAFGMTDDWGFANQALFQQVRGGASGGNGMSAENVGGGTDPEQSAPGAAGGPPFFTRWEYRRSSSTYGFILDRFNRVVQIEAIGMDDPRVHTLKGVRFGTSFGDVLKRYGAPDAYDFQGEQIVMHYLVRNKVAFRLNRLGLNKPHVVTGMVVAAGR